MTTENASHQATPAYPAFLRIGLTDRCNLKCEFCPRDEYFEAIGGGKGVFLSLENLRKLEPAIAAARKVSLTGFGEPTVHPQFFEIIDYICRTCSAERPICIITNGTTLSERHAHALAGRIGSIAVSLNAATSETYRQVAHFDLDKVTSKIRNFARALSEQDRSRVALHFVVDGEVMHEMPAFVRLTHELGLSRARFDEYRLIRESDFDRTLLCKHEEYTRLLEEAFSEGERLGVQVIGREFFKEQPRIFTKELYCKSPMIEAVIDPYGSVTPCCYTGQSMGNAFQDGIEKVWEGPLYSMLRKSRCLGQCKVCNVFHRPEDSVSHIASHMKFAPRTTAFLENWNAKIDQAHSNDADVLQRDLTMYERATKYSSKFATEFAEKVQLLLLTDFSRHYFDPDLPSCDQDDTWAALDRALIVAANQYNSIALEAGCNEMVGNLIGFGWQVSGHGLANGERYIVDGIQAGFFLRRRQGETVRFRLTSMTPRTQLLLSIDGGTPSLADDEASTGDLVWTLPPAMIDGVATLSLTVSVSAKKSMRTYFFGGRAQTRTRATIRKIMIEDCG